MTKKRAQRSETMIALRARRQAFTVANEIRNPRVDVGQTVCPLCHAEVHVLDQHEVECPRCNERLNWPADFVARAVPLEGSVHLYIEDAPPGGAFVSCTNCRTEQWFRSVDEICGVHCARCDQELIPPSDDFDRRCERVAFDKRKRDVFYTVSAIIILILIASVAAVAILDNMNR